MMKNNKALLHFSLLIISLPLFSVITFALLGINGILLIDIIFLVTLIFLSLESKSRRRLNK